ncbi:MAG: NUDIX domain-containing protein [Nitrososphaeria archaeon]
MPIPSVEAIVRNDTILFLKRKNEPAKGQWWLPGGRIRKGESIEEALFRKIKEETGLTVTEYKLVNVYSRVFPQRHDIAMVFLCKCSDDEIRLNDEHTMFKFFKNIPKIFIHIYLKQLEM